MQLALLHRLAQWLAGTQQVNLTDEFIEIARPHSVGQRPEFTGLAYLTRPEGLLILPAFGLALLAIQTYPPWRCTFGRLLKCGGTMALATCLVGATYVCVIGGLTNKGEPRPQSTVASPAAHRPLWSALADAAPSGVQRIGLRPEHLRVAAPGQGVAAKVELAEHLGDVSIVHLRVEGVTELLAAKVPAGQARVDAGQAVGLMADAAWALRFGADARLAP